MVLRFNCNDALVLYHCNVFGLSTNEKTHHLFCNCEREHKIEVMCTERMCDTCTVKSYSTLWMLSHQMKHNQNKNVTPKSCLKNDEYPCDQCTSSFTAMRNLNLHLRIKHSFDDKITWYKCEICTNWKSKYLRGLNRHLTSKHSARKKLYKCKECDYKTSAICALKIHIIDRHTSDFLINWYNCNMCSYRAKHKSRLNQHKRALHMPEDQIIWFECRVCDFKAKKRYSLKSHVEARHSTNQQLLKHKCKLCVYKAKEEWSLIKHVKRMHSSNDEANKFSCQICDASYKHQYSVKRHMLSYHPTEKICLDCGFKANDILNLRMHMKDQHLKTKKRYECDTCLYETNMKTYFIVHLKTGHSAKEVTA